jgi:hypothetical protein
LVTLCYTVQEIGHKITTVIFKAGHLRYK